eukprot:NODE_301_length_1685_cov_880.184049.p2 GENE.NODE_301_length_1685_cov_880.184049~~NODE_301_length_1685_cov_880.184049.p2  ORF type:complete len:268 (-),score=89.14 NODE_301_length_1685_cov_880.184049:151-954(-)
MRTVPELVTMVKGMRVATRAVMASSLLVTLLVYAFAILLNMLVRDEQAVSTHFGTLPLTMWTLVISGTFLDDTGAILGELRDVGTTNTTLCVCAFLIFIMLGTITVMNMLIGVLCEVACAVAAGEKDAFDICILKEHVLVVLKAFDTTGNGNLCRAEFENVLKDDRSVNFLEALHIDTAHFRILMSMLYEDNKTEIPIAVVMQMFLNSRGDLPVTIEHLNDMLQLLFWRVRGALEKFHEKVHTEMLQPRPQLTEHHVAQALVKVSTL